MKSQRTVKRKVVKVKVTTLKKSTMNPNITPIPTPNLELASHLLDGISPARSALNYVGGAAEEFSHSSNHEPNTKSGLTINHSKSTKTKLMAPVVDPAAEVCTEEQKDQNILQLHHPSNTLMVNGNDI
jgi:hypothetical protein